MSVTTAAVLVSIAASAFLLLGPFLGSYLGIYDEILTENVTISIIEILKRPETMTPQGKIRGINMVTHYNRTIFGFIGIPYAQPPVGDRRFKAPVAPDAWTEVLDASNDSIACPQFSLDGKLSGDEDCLYLNVFTPELPSSDNSTLLPVMVYVVGGGFKTENQSIKRFGPDFLLDKDIVLVIPNFRVGVLGFLSTGDEVAPGNYGLKDIVRALQWVQDSIQYFGGDPKQVTIFGGSSGGMSVHLLALSNLTDGLIHRFITQSGTASYNPINRPREVAASRAVQLGEHFGCPTNTSTILVDCLRGFNALQLVDTESVFREWGPFPNNVWNPIVEPDIEGALLIDTPANLIAAGKIRDLPWIVGCNLDDGVVFSAQFYEKPDSFQDFLDNIDLILPFLLEYEGLVDNTPSYTSALRSYYFNDLTADLSLLMDNLTNLVSDALVIYPTYNAIQQQLALAKSPQYFYSFEYHGTFSHYYVFSGGSTNYTGVAHGDELLYLFENHDFIYGPPDFVYSDTDLAMIETMVQLWTSFAINGTPATINSDSTVIWEPYSSLNNYLQIGNGSDTALKMKYDLVLERMKFWDEFTKATTG